jgi:hypothetical protein
MAGTVAGHDEGRGAGLPRADRDGWHGGLP